MRFGPTLRLVWSVAPGWTVANIALAVIQGLLPLLGIGLIVLIVNAVTKATEAADPSASWGHVAFLIVVAAVVGLVTAATRSIATLVTETQTQVVTDHVSDLIHAKSIEVDLAVLRELRATTTCCTAPSRRRPAGP